MVWPPSLFPPQSHHHHHHTIPLGEGSDNDDDDKDSDEITDDEEVFLINKILAHRGKLRRSFLCSWVSYDEEEPTLEPEKSLLNMSRPYRVYLCIP